MYLWFIYSCKFGGFMNNRAYKKGLVVVLIIALIVMAAMGIKLSEKKDEAVLSIHDNYEENSDVLEETKNSRIFIDIDGAVINPGVYELSEGDRVIDAINKAGGLSEDAFTKNLNKARLLVDGEKIYILTEEEIHTKEDSNLVNINTASINDLMSLPGIGEIYAKRIIDYRNDNAFASVEEIKNIEGIGDKTFEKIKDLITIDN